MWPGMVWAFAVVASTPLLGPVAPGPHAVALRLLAERDALRADRPIQIALWLPADDAAADAPGRVYEDYVALRLAERDLVPAPEEAVARASAGWRSVLAERGIPDAIARAWLSSPMLARQGAAPAAGRVRLVLVAQGNGQSAVDQAVLSELLASHGYAVATCPSPMNLSGPMRDESEIRPRAEEQAADLSFVLRRLGREPGVDATRVALVAHSFGARGALLFAMQEPSVRALISLDGGIGTALGREALEGSSWFAKAGPAIPILHAYEELDDFMRPDFGLLRQVAGPRLELLEARGMHHVHFTSLGFAAAAWPEVAGATGAGSELGESLAAIVGRALATLERAFAAEDAPG